MHAMISLDRGRLKYILHTYGVYSVRTLEDAETESLHVDSVLAVEERTSVRNSDLWQLIYNV
jgi:hypothetical protein